MQHMLWTDKLLQLLELTGIQHCAPFYQDRQTPSAAAVLGWSGEKGPPG